VLVPEEEVEMSHIIRENPFRTLTAEEIQEWLEFNLQINSAAESKTWMERAFAACLTLGIVEQPSLAHSIIVCDDNRQTVGGVIVSSQTRVLACFTVNSDASFQLDEEQTHAFRTVLPDHVVAILLASYATRKSAIN
jgi:hypothetical protein